MLLCLSPIFITTKRIIMKRFLSLATIIILMIFVPHSVSADTDETSSFPVTQTDSNGPHSDDEDTHKGNRIPARHLECTVSIDAGVFIPSVDSSEIISYEIYDSTGNQTAIFSMEEDFVEYFFTLHGDYIIRFNTISRSFIGQVSL